MDVYLVSDQQSTSESKEWDGEPDQEKSKMDQVTTVDLQQTVLWGAGRQNHQGSKTVGDTDQLAKRYKAHF